MSALLAVTGFFRPEEMRVLQSLRSMRGRPPSTPAAAPPDTIEMAGEIVTTDIPDDPHPREAVDVLETMTRRNLVLPAILVVAAALRLVGLQFGLPAVYNPDEVAIMARALGFAKGTLNPHNFLYPTFYFYVLFAWVGVYLAFVWATGRVTSLAALQRLYYTDPAGIYTAGRTLGVAAGTATVWLRLPARDADRRRSHRRCRRRLPRGLAASRARLALRQARRAGNAGDRRRLPRDRTAVAGPGRRAA